MIFFANIFCSGNLRVELESVMYCDVRQEHSYLVGDLLLFFHLV